MAPSPAVSTLDAGSMRAPAGRVPIFASDFCHPMLVRAIAKTKKKRAAHLIQIIEADAQELPFPDNTFQVAAVAFGLRNVTDFRRGLSEMARVVRPGGRVAVL